MIGNIKNWASPIHGTANAFFVNGLAASLHFSRSLDAESAVGRVAKVLAALRQSLPAFLAKTDFAGIGFRLHLLSGKVGDVVKTTSVQTRKLGVALSDSRATRVRILEMLPSCISDFLPRHYNK